MNLALQQIWSICCCNPACAPQAPFFPWPNLIQARNRMQIDSRRNAATQAIVGTGNSFKPPTLALNFSTIVICRKQGGARQRKPKSRACDIKQQSGVTSVGIPVARKLCKHTWPLLQRAAVASLTCLSRIPTGMIKLTVIVP